MYDEVEIENIMNGNESESHKAQSNKNVKSLLKLNSIKKI